MSDFDLRDGRLGAVVGTTRLTKKCELEGASSGLASGTSTSGLHPLPPLES